MEPRLTFTTTPKHKNIVYVCNEKEETLGYLEKRRCGAYMTWWLYLYEDCGLTAGCQDEVREKTKELNAEIMRKKT